MNITRKGYGILLDIGIVFEVHYSVPSDAALYAFPSTMQVIALDERDVREFMEEKHPDKKILSIGKAL